LPKITFNKKNANIPYRSSSNIEYCIHVLQIKAHVPPTETPMHRHVTETCPNFCNFPTRHKTLQHIQQTLSFTLPSGLFGLFKMIIFVLLLNLLASSCGSSFQSALDMTLPCLHCRNRTAEM